MAKDEDRYIICWSETGCPDEDFKSKRLHGVSKDFVNGYVQALSDKGYPKIFFALIPEK